MIMYVVKSGQFRPKDRDYNKHGGLRQEQFEKMATAIPPALDSG